MAAEYAIFAEIGRVISSSPNIQDVYEGFASQVRNVIPFDRLVINTVNLDSGTVVTLYQSGENIPEWAPGLVRPLADSPTDWIVKNRSGLVFSPDSEQLDQERFHQPVPSPNEGVEMAGCRASHISETRLSARCTSGRATQMPIVSAALNWQTGSASQIAEP